MRLVITSPLLDLKMADGKTVSIAENLTPDQFRSLLLEGAQEMAKAIRNTLTSSAVFDAALRNVLLEGLYIEPEFSEKVEKTNPAARVKVQDNDGFVCHKCRQPATGFQLRGTCAAHGVNAQPAQSPLVRG